MEKTASASKTKRPAKSISDSATDLTSDKNLSRTTRFTEKYCTFWNGPLSNWHMGPTFSGKRCMDLLLPQLDEYNVPHPSADAFSTRLIGSHLFTCGEQFMMAAKAWVFEGKLKLAKMSVSKMSANDIQAAVSEMMANVAPGDDSDFESMSSLSARKEMYNSALPKILRASHPREQKALGRQVQGYRDDVWQQVSHHAVVAGSIARAEQDSQLRELYRNIGNRHFVEGSPSDRIWGVGLKFNNSLIDDERNWKGQNRLGICHDEAAKFIRDMPA